MDSLIFVWVNICSATIISISHYWGSLTWQTKKNGKWLYFQWYEWFPKKFLYNLQRLDILVMWILIYFNWSILVQIQSYLFLITPIQCIGDHKILVKWIQLHKYEELPQIVFFHIFGDGYTSHIYPVILFLGENWSRYNILCFLLLRFILLMITKYWGNGYSSRNI